MKQRVIALKTERTPLEYSEFFEPKGLALANGNWFVRFLWWLIGKFEHRFAHRIRKESYRTVAIDSDSIIEAVRLNSNDIRRIWDLEAKFLLVGRDMAHQLFGEIESRHNFAFPIEGRFGFNGQTKFLGLTVVVIPWMDGFCLAPSLKEYA